MKKPSEKLKMSAKKAKKILEDDEVHGKKLTKKQRGMFGAKAGKAKRSKSGCGK